ncbi:MAG: hypothetical protein ACI308_03925 [Muribaculaceae bacterium]
MKPYTFSRSILSVAIALMALCTVSCSDDDPVKTPIAQPTIQVTYATYNTLTFEWNAVGGAVQYGYKLYNSMGELIDGGVTGNTTATFTGLTLQSEYTLHLWAYPTMANETAIASDEAILSYTTPFYTALNYQGVTYSAVVPNGAYNATIVEERTNQNAFGTFTIKRFYGVEGYDLQFTVNDDNTINIVNGEVYDDDGWIIVMPGLNNVRVKNGLLIDPSRSYFDRENFELYYYAKGTRGSSEGYDYFVWTE